LRVHAFHGGTAPRGGLETATGRDGGGLTSPPASARPAGPEMKDDSKDGQGRRAESTQGRPRKAAAVASEKRSGKLRGTRGFGREQVFAMASEATDRREEGRRRDAVIVRRDDGTRTIKLRRKGIGRFAPTEKSSAPSHPFSLFLHRITLPPSTVTRHHTPPWTRPGEPLSLRRGVCKENHNGVEHPLHGGGLGLCCSWAVRTPRQRRPKQGAATKLSGRGVVRKRSWTKWGEELQPWPRGRDQYQPTGSKSGVADDGKGPSI